MLDRVESKIKQAQEVPDYWKPDPDNVPQCLAYESKADIVGYGGQAGGGKTDLLLGKAITCHKKAIIFRREYPQLTALIDRSHEVLDITPAMYNSGRHRWTGIGGNRSLEFGSVQYDTDKQKYQGRPHDFIGIDEAANFSESIVKFLTAWARTTDKQQTVQIMMCFNPPMDSEGMWIIDYFAPWLDEKHPDPAKPGELRWYVGTPDGDITAEGPGSVEHKGETLTPKSRTFFPASLDDNSYLRDSEYKGTLQSLPEPMRSMLLYGEFASSIGEDPWQVIPTAWVKAAFDRWDAQPQPDTPLTAIGADIARGGKDKTVFALRYSNWFAPLIKIPGSGTPDGPSVVGRLATIPDSGGSTIGIDEIGVGYSVVDYMRDYGFKIVPINSSQKAIDEFTGQIYTDRSGQLKFRNVRAMIYWQLREALDPELGDDLALSRDSELLADLTAAKWKVTAQGILIESKADIVKRLKRSPDCADAVAYAHYIKPSVDVSWNDVKPGKDQTPDFI